MPDYDRMMALNAKLWRDSGSKFQTENRWWLWMPKLRRNGGSKHPNWEGMVASNVKPKRDGGSERRNWEGRLWTLNWEGQLWTSQLRINGSSECQTEEDEGFECHNWELKSLNVKLRKTTLNVVIEKRWWLWMLSCKEIMTLNTKLKRDGGSECPTEKGWWLWMPKLRRDGGSERRNWKGLLWTSNWEAMMALNSEL